VRIALVSYHTSPLASLGSSSAGGMNVYVRRLAEGLAARDVEVDIFTRQECADCEREQEFTPGARVITVRAGPTRVITKDDLAAYAPCFAGNLARYISRRNLRYDAIHSHYWLSGLAAQALRTERQPLVHMFHTLSRVKRHYQADAGKNDPPSRDYGEMSLLRSGQTLVFSTDAEVDDVERLYGFRPKSVAIIPPGVDGVVFGPEDREGARRALGLGSEPLILFVGRMDPAKGVDLLLQAIARLRNRQDQPAARLLVVGGDDGNRDAMAHRELERLKQIANGLGIAERVQWEGVVPQRMLRLFYAASDLCAVPSRYESFGMVALEALSCGRPVVGFRSPGLEQTVRQDRTGILVPSGDVESLAAALDRLVADTQLARRMGLEASQSAKPFSWNRVADLTADLYADLIGRGEESLAPRTSRVMSGRR